MFIAFHLRPKPNHVYNYAHVQRHHIVAIVKLSGYVRPVLCYDKYKFCPWSFLYSFTSRVK